MTPHRQQAIAVERPINTSRLKAVVFDIDGTLYRQPPVRRAMLGRLLASAVAHPRRGAETFRVLQAYRRAQETLRGAPVAGGVAAAQIRLACDQTNVDAETVSRYVTRWMEEEPLALLPRCVQPGALALLHECRARGLRLAALSDYPAEAKLHALGMTGLFDLVLCAQAPEVNVFKPHPRGLLAILERLDTNAAECLYVGDRADVDAAAADAAGVACAIVTTRRRARDTPSYIYSGCESFTACRTCCGHETSGRRRERAIDKRRTAARVDRSPRTNRCGSPLAGRSAPDADREVQSEGIADHLRCRLELGFATATARHDAELQAVEVPPRLHPAIRAGDRRGPRGRMLQVQLHRLHRPRLRKGWHPEDLRHGSVHRHAVVEHVGRLLRERTAETGTVRARRSGDAASHHSLEYPWKDPISVLHIDADHEYEAVWNDIEKYTPFLVAGGIVVFDDYDVSHAGVTKAVHRLLAEYPRFEVVAANYQGAEFGSLTLRRTRD